MTNANLSHSEAHSIKCQLAGEVLRSFGKLRLQVQGWSMLPSVYPGDTLVIERARGHQVAEGDIVLFSRDKRLFAHRVTRKTSGNLVIQTRGDAMVAPDPEVPESELLGRVSFIIRKGTCFVPRQTLRSRDRAVAALVRRSQLAARLIVGIHGFRTASST